MKILHTLFLLLSIVAFQTTQAQMSVCDSSGYSLSLAIVNVSCPKGATGVATVASTGCTCMFSGCIFTWSNGQIGHTISGLTAGTYSVTVSHPNGCVLDTSLTITEPASFVDHITKEDPSCYQLNDGLASVVSAPESGILRYAWSNGDTLATMSNQAAGKYYVTTTNIINCSLVDSIELVEPTAVAATLSTSPSCSSGTTGAVNMNISGGTPPYTCLWSNGLTTQNINNIAAGTYTAETSDANGCNKQYTATVSSIPSPTPTIASSPNPTICVGASTQIIAVSSGGGASYSWSPTTGLNAPNSNAPIASPAQTTTYTVSATASNGCVGTAQVTVTVNVCSDVEYINAADLQISPNPFSDYLTIDIANLAANEKATIRLYNTLGQAIHVQSCTQGYGTSNSNTQIDLSSLSQGVYILEAQAGNRVYRRQIVKLP
jgi:hypothetical protein